MPSTRSRRRRRRRANPFGTFSTFRRRRLKDGTVGTVCQGKSSQCWRGFAVGIHQGRCQTTSDPKDPRQCQVAPHRCHHRETTTAPKANSFCFSFLLCIGGGGHDLLFAAASHNIIAPKTNESPKKSTARSVSCVRFSAAFPLSATCFSFVELG